MSLRGATVCASVVFALVGCADRQGTPRRLNSRKEIRVLEAGVVDHSFVVEYCSEVPLGNRAMLGREADEVFDSFRNDLAQSGRSEASLWPTVCKWQVRWAGWKPVVLREQSTEFGYVRSADGTWTRRD